MVAASFRPVKPRPTSARFLPTVAVLGVAALVGLAVPVSSEHPQRVTTAGGSFSAQFDHGGDNEWWVEFEARALDGGSIFIAFARVEGTSTWHYMKFAANDWERQQQGWSKFAPDRAFQVPAGKRVQFQVHMTDDGTQETGIVDSCWFTHPAGVEQCGTTTTSSSTTTSGGTFDAPFTGFRGNEWWVQANVGTNGPAIAKVDVRIAPDGPWKPLAKQSWGPTAWAASYHFPQGSILQMRATATDGRTDLSSCRQWIPPSGQDAAIVACPGSQPPGFDATFSGVKGNEWWVQASVSGNQPIQNVDARIDCSEEWRSLTKRSYGWAASFHVPAGSKVDFRATSTSGNMDFSGGYIWPQATPTTACSATPAWPQENSFATYQLHNTLCGSGNCWSSEAALQVRYRSGAWTAECVGTTRESLVDGTETTYEWRNTLAFAPVRYPSPATVGQDVTAPIAVIRHQDSTLGSQGRCEVQSHMVGVQGQQDTLTSLPGNPVLRAWWGDEDDPEFTGTEDRFAAWETKLGLALEWDRSGRRSGMASFGGDLVDTDAPIR